MTFMNGINLITYTYTLVHVRTYIYTIYRRKGAFTLYITEVARIYYNLYASPVNEFESDCGAKNERKLH